MKRQMAFIRESGVVNVTERGRNRSNVYDLTPLVEVVRQFRARRTSDATLNAEAATSKDAPRQEAENVGAARPDPADASGGATQAQAQPEAPAAGQPTNAPRPARFGKPVYDWERLDLTIPEELQKLFAAFEAEEAKPPDPEREKRKHEVAAYRHAVHMKLGGYDRPVKHSPHVERILARQARSIAGLE